MISPWICGLEEETWAMQKEKKKVYGHMKVQVQKKKNDEHMKAHVLKKRERRKIAMFQNNKL